MKNKILLLLSYLMLSGCYTQAAFERGVDSTIGKKFDAYHFIDMSPAECDEEANQRIYRLQHHLPRGLNLFPWHPLNRENCGIHKISETSKTADYEITYYGTCKYIYTVEKKTDLILAWRYTKDSKNCVPGP